MAFALWLRVVTASVPPERLLLLDLFTTPSEELWRQLCAFLGRPLPSAGPGEQSPDGVLPLFPHLHYGDDMKDEL